MQTNFRWRPAAALELGSRATNTAALLFLAAVAIIIGFQVRPDTYLSGLALLFAAMAGSCLLLLRPGMNLGFTLLLLTSVLVPYDFGRAGLNLAMILVALLTGVWVIEMVLERKLPPFPKRTALPLVLFMAGATLSFVLGQFSRFPTESAPMQAQAGGLAIFLLSGAAFLLMAVRLSTLVQLKRLTAAFLVFGALLTVLIVIPALQALMFNLVNPSSVGSLFWTWLAAIAFSQALLNRDLQPLTRLGLLLITGLVLYQGLYVNLSWVSGWLPVLVALGVIAAFRYPRLFFALSLLALPVLLMFLQSLLNPVLSNEQYSMDTRFVAWKVVLKIVEASPLVGLGPANYFYYTPLFPILGWYVRFSSHNNYLDILAQTGLIGLLLFAWFLFEIGRMLWKLRNSVASSFSRAYVHGALGGLAGTLVAGMLGDWLLPFVYNVGLRGFRSSVLAWIFLGGVVALSRLHPALEPGQKEPDQARNNSSITSNRS
jgi:hypothetical protein